jgi:hypothetical protein
MKKLLSILFALLVAGSAASAGATTLGGTPVPIRRVPLAGRAKSAATLQASASGVGINLDVVGRLVGGGNTLFKTSVDIANNTNTPTQVDAYFAGIVSGVHTEPQALQVTAAGLVGPNSSSQLAAHSVFHTDDFIDDLRVAGLISQADEDAGILGSLLVIYNSPSAGLFNSTVGQGAVQARFYSTVAAGNGSLSGGTIGVSANGHELTGSEPTSLVGIARDTILIANTPQVYTNFFINNEGYPDSSGHPVVSTVQIRLTGYSNSTHSITGQSNPITIGQYETAVIGNIFQLLGGNLATDDTLIVFVDIISGNSAISGLSSTNDNTTKDPSGAQLRPADWSAGR